ncbi:hypothetical protein evm_010509 [Chilo suppressalis]|nr:hypothetical protein evm_010509 [Chilo suppressalis]
MESRAQARNSFCEKHFETKFLTWTRTLSPHAVQLFARSVSTDVTNRWILTKELNILSFQCLLHPLHLQWIKV